MNKKGQSEEGWGETSNYIKIFYLATAAIIGVLYLVNTGANAISDNLTANEKVDNFLAFEAVRHCFLYENNGRVHYDKIDLTKFDETKLAACLPDVPAAVMLKSMDGSESKIIENSLSVASPGTTYTYYMNVQGSDKSYEMTVKI